MTSFHPLKAGRRPLAERCLKGVLQMFPSPQGGSETPLLKIREGHFNRVSIPSRRVGDGRQAEHRRLGCPCFHPLKAGRRRAQPRADRATASFPSPQGGSETEIQKQVTRSSLTFPSPQGGSETSFGRMMGITLRNVSIPSRRVGDQGEMRGKAGKRRQKGGRVAVDLR